MMVLASEEQDGPARRRRIARTIGVLTVEGGVRSASPGRAGPVSYARESGNADPAAANTGRSFQAAPWRTVGMPASGSVHHWFSLVRRTQASMPDFPSANTPPIAAHCSSLNAGYSRALN